MKRFTTCLWFNNQAEAAAKFYTSIFKNSRIGVVARYGAAGAKVSGQRKGSVMTVAFRLDGQDFLGLNGGKYFKFSPAISIVVRCRTQREIDYYWSRLLRGGKPSVCGWLTDKFGVSWQVTPAEMERWMADGNPERANRVMQAVVSMRKLDLARLRRAYAGD